jgi:hypothetical protein
LTTDLTVKRVMHGLFNLLREELDSGVGARELFMCYMVEQLLANNITTMTRAQNHISLDNAGNGCAVKGSWSSLREWLNTIFMNITGDNYSNLGSSKNRGRFNMRKPGVAWVVGDVREAALSFAQTYTQVALSAQFDDFSHIIEKLCRKSTFNEMIQGQMLERAAYFHSVYAAQNNLEHFWRDVIDVMVSLLEGERGLGGIRTAYINGESSGRNSSSWDFTVLQDPPTWAFTSPFTMAPAAAPGPQTRSRGYRGVNAVTLADFQAHDSSHEGGDMSCRIMVFSRPPKKSLAEMVYKARADAMLVADRPCHVHKAILMNNPDSALTEEEADRMVHKERHCLSEWNENIECTDLPGGAAAIRFRAEMPNGPERKEMYMSQLKEMREVLKSRPRLSCIMENHESQMVAVEWGFGS